MKNEFILAFNEVLEEKQLPKEVILEALQAAMVSAYRRAVNASNAQDVKAAIDLDTGKVTIYAEKEVVDHVQDPRTEVALKEAQQVDQNAEVGGMVVVESTPTDFGRVAAQTARQVIQQRIREAERDSQMSHYSRQLGEIVNGVVQAIGPSQFSLGLDMKAEGVMPRNQMIPGEKFRVHDRVRALLLEVKHTPRGPQIILSRAHRNFLRRLLENEVPEIYHGLVEIRSISREPGQRSKVAVAALQPGVDPVGACVGIRGVRIQAIVRELNDEKIDVIEWNADPAAYIAKALSPARVTGVYLNEHAKGAKTATVVVPEDQLSLAIGRDGQNARLAAKLTSWRIDIKSLPEAGTDALYKLQHQPEYAFMIESETSVVPQVEAILAKKAEGRPVTPEEYQTLSQFVDRVERGLIRQRMAEIKAKEERQKAIRVPVREEPSALPLEKLDLSERIYNLLSEAGYQSIGDLQYQMSTNPDEILGLNGIGPKAMQEIEKALEAFRVPEKKAEEAAPAEVKEEAAVPAPVEGPAVAEAGMAAVPESVQAGETVVDTARAEEAPVIEVEAAPEAVQPDLSIEAVAEPAASQTEAEAPHVVEPVEVAPIEAAPVEEVRPIETVEQKQPEAQVETQPVMAETPAEAPKAEQEEEMPSSLDELFALKPEVLEMVEPSEDEEDEDDRSGQSKKKKKKKKFVEMEYDPDKDVVVVKKKRKRGGEAWGDEW